jgi:hypothetical protein
LLQHGKPLYAVNGVPQTDLFAATFSSFFWLAGTTVAQSNREIVTETALARRCENRGNALRPSEKVEKNVGKKSQIFGSNYSPRKAQFCGIF